MALWENWLLQHVLRCRERGEVLLELVEFLVDLRLESRCCDLRGLVDELPEEEAEDTLVLVLHTSLLRSLRIFGGGDRHDVIWQL